MGDKSEVGKLPRVAVRPVILVVIVLATAASTAPAISDTRRAVEQAKPTDTADCTELTGAARCQHGHVVGRRLQVLLRLLLLLVVVLVAVWCWLLLRFGLFVCFV